MLVARGKQGWRAQAACGGTNPEAWTSPNFGNAHLSIPEHVRMCQACPVLRECASDASIARDVGVIRAGIIIPTTGPGRRRAWEVLALIAVTGNVEYSGAVLSKEGKK